MNRHDFVRIVAKRINETTDKSVTIKEATTIVDTVFDIVKETLIKGEDMPIYNFGNFSVVMQKGRTGIITIGDRKGEKFVSPDKKVVKFKALKPLRDAVSGIVEDGDEQ